ncbi:hypothetical protein GCM10009613_05500 [Pseudonocardia kongjuensis]|uniref:Uncharacterized protein n=1 Tax=Pseudonocardia kongjuensis TaxID=102227 RepID=A0ABN1XH92_9PSEU
MTKKINKAFVEKWAGRYDPMVDAPVLRDVHPAVHDRGYFTKAEGEAVMKWKSNRTLPLFQENAEDDVEAITTMALGGPDRLAHRVLRLLRGVGNPVASAFLTVADPTRFTVVDFRAIRALQQHGEQVADDPYYREYVDLCASIARRCETDLRTLDRALWQYDKATNGK